MVQERGPTGLGDPPRPSTHKCLQLVLICRHADLDITSSSLVPDHHIVLHPHPTPRKPAKADGVWRQAQARLASERSARCGQAVAARSGGAVGVLAKPVACNAPAAWQLHSTGSQPECVKRRTHRVRVDGL
jgi:hypothetical protein